MTKTYRYRGLSRVLHIIVDSTQASLWGVECNYPGTDNGYLTTVANELLAEALDAAKAAASRLTATVTGWAKT